MYRVKSLQTSRIMFSLMASGCVLTALLSYRFILMGLDAAFGDVSVFAALLVDARLAIIVHVVAAPVALIVGWLQFSSRLRTRQAGIHRWTGRIYVAAVVIGGAAALWLSATQMLERPATGIGFTVLAIIWVAVTGCGVVAAKDRDFDTHRQCMMISFALTFGAVTLRIQMFAASAMGFTYPEVSGFLAWSSWVPNLVFTILILSFWQHKR